MLQPLRRPLAARTITVLFLLGLVLGANSAAFSDQIKIPGGQFDRKKAVDGARFDAPGWELRGDATWRRVEDNGSVELQPRSVISRSVEVKPLRARKGRPEIVDPAMWAGVLSLSVATADGASSASSVRVQLQPPQGAGSGQAATLIAGERTVQPGAPRRLWIAVPPPLQRDGKWSIEISPIGTEPVVVDDLRWVRVPTTIDGMKPEKPNGFNGPDRIEIGPLGLTAYTMHQTAALPIRAVRPGSPADHAGLQPGDVVIEVDGADLPVNSCAPGHDWFDHGHESVLGRAVERVQTSSAESDATPAVRLSVLRFEGKNAETVALQLALEKRPPLPESFPFDDTVTPRLYDDLLDFVRRTRQAKGRQAGTWSNGGNRPIQTAFAGLALLGRRNPADFETIHEIADWFLETYHDPESFGNLGYWFTGYAGIFLAEYWLATGDDRVRPWAKRSLGWVERGTHTSKWGTTALGHGPNGLPYGFKALVAPATHVLVFEALVRRAGLETTVWTDLLPYMKEAWSNPADGGHGALGYNRAARDQREFWSRTGLFALAARLRGEEPEMRSAMAKVMRERHVWMRNSHAYGQPGDAWGLISLSQIDDAAFREVMRKWRWAFSGAWETGYGLRHSTAHMGAPYMGTEGLINPAFAALLSVRHQGLHITGATDRGWLPPRRNFPTKAVTIARGTDGRVTLRSKVPGPEIRYTVDGTEPTADSPRYQEPIELESGWIRARAVSDTGRRGPIASRWLHPPKSSWTIVQPTEPSARERALGAIDHDPIQPWRTDRGQTDQVHPHVLVIDLGRAEPFTGITLRNTTATHVKVTLGLELDESGQPAGGDHAPTWSEKIEASGKGTHDLELGGESLQEARFIRLEVLASRNETPHTTVGELDLRWPEVEARRTDAGIAWVHAEIPNVTLRHTVDGTPPQPDSPRYEEPIPLPEKRDLLQARLFRKDGRAIGPIVGYVKKP